MVDGGFVLLWRKFFDHKYWSEKRVFSRAEAWLDCWGNMAAFDAHEKISGGRRMQLERGQFVASDRFLERRWRWSRGKVRRFLAECVAAGELLRVTMMNGGCSENDTAGGTIYAVVNYEDYQPRSTSNGTTERPLTVPPTDQREAKKASKTKSPKGPIGPRWKVVPESWAGPTDKHCELAVKHGLDVEIEAQKYRAHEYPRAKTDADRTFTSWLLKAAEFKKKRNGNGRSPPTNADDATARVIAFRRSLDNVSLSGTHD